MFNLKDANFNEELVIKELLGTKEQINFLEYLGMMVESTIVVLKPGVLPNTLLVKSNDTIYQLNPDIINRIKVEQKGKVYKK